MARKRKQNEEAPGWVWMLFGLAIGLIIALGVYINKPSDSAPKPLTAQPQDLEPAQAETLPAIEDTAAEMADNTDDGAVTTKPNEDPNRFSFYDVLPQFEVIVPEVETPARRRSPTVAIAEPGTYVLQAGSFRADTDAESRRAQLALLGIESRLQRVSIDDQTFHRVRIGPIAELDELNDIRSRLLDANIDSLVMRLTE